MKSTMLFGFFLLVIFVVIYPVSCAKCRGKCDMECPAGNKTCSQDCSVGPCTMTCDGNEICSQHCQNDTLCETMTCNSQTCAQLCRGDCPNIKCQAKSCSQLCLDKKCKMNCNGNCSQETVNPGSTQVCQGECSQLCLGGNCPQTCSDGPCYQACTDSGGCTQSCDSKDKCSQLCEKGNCIQDAVGKLITQQCVGGDCKLAAEGKTSNSISSQICIDRDCKMKVSFTENSTMMCTGRTCTAECAAKRCLVFCNATVSCDIKCTKAEECSMTCSSQKCGMDCGQTTFCTRTENIISGPIAGASQNSGIQVSFSFFNFFFILILLTLNIFI